MALTPKQTRFVAEYLIDLNATQAAIRAGYSQKNAQSIGYQLLQKTPVQVAIQAGQTKQLAGAELSAARVLEEIRRLAFADARDIYDDHGNLKPMSEWSPEAAATVSGIETIVKNAKAGDGVTDTVLKVRRWDKPKALECLAKHFGLLTERVQHSGELRILHELGE